MAYVKQINIIGPLSLIYNDGLFNSSDLLADSLHLDLNGFEIIESDSNRVSYPMVRPSSCALTQKVIASKV